LKAAPRSSWIAASRAHCGNTSSQPTEKHKMAATKLVALQSERDTALALLTFVDSNCEENLADKCAPFLNQNNVKEIVKSCVPFAQAILASSADPKGDT
jgi:hypothetical protein